LFPPILWLLQRAPTWALAVSAAMYVVAWWFNTNLPSYPSGVWYFNPFTWQLPFVFGAWFALGGATRLGPALRSRVTMGIALLYIGFAFVIALTWYLPGLTHYVHLPVWLEDLIYPIDKTNLDVLRFAHFLALAAVTVRFIPRTWPMLEASALRPAIRCGQHSLEIFCLGVFLAFAAHFALVEVSGAIWMQFLVSALGILIMVATAALISWYKKIEGRGSTTRPKQSDADLAGGEA